MINYFLDIETTLKETDKIKKEYNLEIKDLTKQNRSYIIIFK